MNELTDPKTLRQMDTMNADELAARQEHRGALGSHLNRQGSGTLFFPISQSGDAV